MDVIVGMLAVGAVGITLMLVIEFAIRRRSRGERMTAEHPSFETPHPIRDIRHHGYFGEGDRGPYDRGFNTGSHGGLFDGGGGAGSGGGGDGGGG